MPSALTAVRGFSPFDEALGLSESDYLPSIQQLAVNLGTRMSFAEAKEMLGQSIGVVAGVSSIRRWVLAAGTAHVRVQADALATLEQQLPNQPAAPELLQVSADGAMVPLRGGEWAEVRTLAVGEVVQQLVAGEAVTKTLNLSYYSRLASAAEFSEQVWVELWRRGCEEAKAVVSVSDGANWIQELLDLNCARAVRILDYPHALEYVAKAGHIHYPEAQSGEFAAWYVAQAQELKHGQAERVIEAVRALGEAEQVSQSVNYLRSRLAMLRYSEFQAKGYPIGSGCVESANKLVVERRMKGAGMRWERKNVNPMLALRNLVCNQRWEEGWAAIRQQQQLEQQTQRQAQRKAKKQAAIPPASPTLEADAKVKKEVGHAYRHVPIGRAKYLTYTERVTARR